MSRKASPLHIGIFVAAVFAVSIVAGNYFGWARPVRQAISSIERAARVIFFGPEVSLSTFADSAGLLSQIVELQAVERENQILREQLDFLKQSSFEFRVANVVSLDPTVPSLLYVDRGSDDGVAKGQPVVAGEGVIVGKVLQSSSSASAVELLSAEPSRLAVETLDSRTGGIVRGVLGSTIQMENILAGAPISVDDLVVTSGIEPLIPYGLLVGTVATPAESPDGLFAETAIAPLINYSKLSVVTILLRDESH